MKSASIDYTNTNAGNIRFHFGKVCKADYIGGSPLSVSTGEYLYKIPDQPLPTIISDGTGASIEAIRSYFTDEQVVRGISDHVGIEYDDLVNGNYKLQLIYSFTPHHLNYYFL